MDLEQSIDSRYRLRAETPVCEERVYYDTFDWLLYSKSLTLYRSGERYVLQSIQDDAVSLHAETTDVVRFATEFPDGDLQRRMLEVASIRALLPVACVTLKSTTARVLNEDEKTVARLVQTDIVAADGDIPETEQSEIHREECEEQVSFFTLHPLRGYEKDRKRISAALPDELEVSSDASAERLHLPCFCQRSRRILVQAECTVVAGDAV